VEAGGRHVRKSESFTRKRSRGGKKEREGGLGLNERFSMKEREFA